MSIAEKTIIVIPTYNEAGNIEPLLTAIFGAAPGLYVLVVDDSSPDGTSAIVSALQKKYPNLMLLVRKEKQGLGVAYRAGFRRALELHPDTKILGMMDADFYHNPKDIPRLLEEAKRTDLVIGSVYAPGGSPSASFTFFRRFLSRGGNIYCRIMFGYPLTDWTNAFVMMRVDALKKINLDELPMREFAFVFGIKYMLVQSGASWKDIGVIANDRPSGESKVTWRTILEGLLAPIPLVVESRLHVSWEVAKFIISGGTAALVQLFLLFFFTEVFGVWYVVSLVLAFSVAFMVSFSLQKFWTFQDKSTHRAHVQMFSYLGIALANLAINSVALYVLVEAVGMWYIFAQVLIEGSIAVSSFLIYKFFIFKKDASSYVTKV